MARAEINRGYLQYLRPAEPPADGAVPSPRQRLRAALSRHLSPATPYLALIGLLLTTALVLPVIRLVTLLRGKPLDDLHAAALKRIDLFVDQYPFHLYPLLCKALELAFLQREISKAAAPGAKVVELAIGDGSLSRNIYPVGLQITAVDISPYSLRVSSRMPHVRRGVIADCLNPPITSGSFDLLVTNNFLHHVSDKEAALDHIARIAGRAVFNENSTYWLSAWPKPFLLHRLGLKSAADTAIRELGARFLQDLRSKPELDAIVAERFEIDSEAAYLCENTYFLCGIFSNLMGVYGPPSPGYMKRLAQVGVVGSLIRACTAALARALIRFDNHQDKARAAFISYSCRSKTFERQQLASDFICPQCQAALPADLRCTACGAEFPSHDGMAFLLPGNMEFIHSRYVSEASQFYENEALEQHH